MWQWLILVGAVFVAVSIQWWWVPRLRTPQVDEGDEPPTFTGLGSLPHLAGAAFFAAAAASLVFVSAPYLWALIFAYAAVGAPLMMVDLRTTYLPNQLMLPLWVAVAAGLIVAVFPYPVVALGGVIGAVAGYALFWLVWRFSSSFGFGDVRLAAAVGALAGTSGSMHWAVSMVLGTALGALAAIVAAAAFRRRTLPYGPWLWLGPVLGGWVATGW